MEEYSALLIYPELDLNHWIQFTFISMTALRFFCWVHSSYSAYILSLTVQYVTPDIIDMINVLK